MSLDELKKNAEILARPIIESLDYELVEVKCEHINKVNQLTFFIYSPKGINYEDCIKVDSSVSAALDEKDISNGSSYVLNISSPGLDRELKTDDDLRRNLGIKLVSLYADDMGKSRKFAGKLQEYNNDTIQITNEKGVTVSILRSTIVSLKAHISFKK